MVAPVRGDHGAPQRGAHRNLTIRMASVEVTGSDHVKLNSIDERVIGNRPRVGRTPPE
jgi:hypothetical protein